MKETPNLDVLEVAIERLYVTFGKYTLHHLVEGCLCCVTDTDVARLHSKRLRELSSNDLAHYAFKAITTWGTEADFKHFLPRLLELVTDDYSITAEVDCEVLFGKLAYANWHRWPQSEQKVLDEYFFSLWRYLLDQSPQHIMIDEFLCGLGRAFDDLTPFLTLWQYTITASAVRHYIDFLDDNTSLLENGKLSSVFWSGRIAQMDQVVKWASDLGTTQSFEHTLDACIRPLEDT